MSCTAVILRVGSLLWLLLKYIAEQIYISLETLDIVTYTVYGIASN